jgi:hypothetical protein
MGDVIVTLVEIVAISFWPDFRLSNCRPNVASLGQLSRRRSQGGMDSSVTLAGLSQGYHWAGSRLLISKHED